MDIKKDNDKKTFKLKLASFLYIIAIITLIVLIILITTVSRPGRVVGTSMMPTLKDGQFIRLNVIDKDIKPGDIIVYKTPDNVNVIKRVVAINKHRIKIENGKLIVDNNETLYPFCYENQYHDEIIMQDGEFFAMGDNQGNSKDSFYYGPLKKDRLIGKVATNKKQRIQIYK